MMATSVLRAMVVVCLATVVIMGAGCAQTQQKKMGDPGDAKAMRAPTDASAKAETAATPAVTVESATPEDSQVAATTDEPSYDDGAQAGPVSKKKSGKKSSKNRSAKKSSNKGSQDNVASSNGLPTWLQKKVNGFSKLPAKQRPISVTQWTWKGKTVYLINPPARSKQVSDLYSAKGTLLGHPTGGKSGQGDGKCNDFVKQRKGGAVVWSRK